MIRISKRELLLDRFKRLRLDQKIECICAAIITMLLVVGVPVYAWFALSENMETLTRIKAPATLDIRAGNKDSIENLELKNIDIEAIKTNSEPSCYVFCVKTGNPDARYDIQLAHTTNIPFTYRLYRAEETTASDPNVVVDYTPINDSTDHTYYKKQTNGFLPLSTLNPDSGYTGRTLGVNYSNTYEAGDGTPEIYAVPVYSQATDIPTQDADYDFFILELDWQSASGGEDFNNWNKAVNNKETDIIYISAKIHTA